MADVNIEIRDEKKLYRTLKNQYINKDDVIAPEHPPLHIPPGSRVPNVHAGGEVGDQCLRGSACASFQDKHPPEFSLLRLTNGRERIAQYFYLCAKCCASHLKLDVEQEFTSDEEFNEVMTRFKEEHNLSCTMNRTGGKTIGDDSVRTHFSASFKKNGEAIGKASAVIDVNVAAGTYKYTYSDFPTL